MTNQNDFDGKTTLLSGFSGVTLGYLPGDMVDNTYQLTKLLGRGGMGAVFACKHLALDKTYALKLLSGDLLSGEAWTRFQAEAKTLARLNHPGIVGIHNMGIDKGQCPYYVMDLLPGETLDSLLKRLGRLSTAQALDIFIRVADALASAHLQGIIHRDIKPSNIMLVQGEISQDTSVKIVDFGIARLPKQGSEAQSQTATGLIFGTPFYMSPEQCQGAKVDQRSDIYSFGCALFEALTGTPPFVGDSAFHTFLMHQTEETPDLSSRAPGQDFPESLAQAVKKMLSKSPDDRYQKISQVKHDLERVKAGKPIMADGMRDTMPPDTGAAAKALAPLPGGSRSHRLNKQHVDADLDSYKTKPTGPLSPLKMVAVLAFFIALALTTIVLLQGINQNQSRKMAESSPRLPDGTARESPKGMPVGNDDNLVTDFVFPSDDGTLPVSSIVYPWEELKKMGASDEELHSLSIQDIAPLDDIKKAAELRLKELSKDPRWTATKFMSDGIFHFPQENFIGVISINDKDPISVKRNIRAPSDKDAFLYLMTPSKVAPELLVKFGPNDLTGIAVLFESPDSLHFALDTMVTWKRLKDLWFFNRLIKTIAKKTDFWGESKLTDKDLPRLDKFKGLRSLGLCNPVSGRAILQRPFLSKIHILGLKRIEDFEPLLKELPRYDNLTELYLMSQGTTDDQLKILARMRHLQKLTVLRGNLTIHSIDSFRKMKALTELRLDRNDWTSDQKKNFADELPHCKVTYERVIDRQVWPKLMDDLRMHGRTKQKSQ